MHASVGNPIGSHFRASVHFGNNTCSGTQTHAHTVTSTDTHDRSGTRTCTLTNTCFDA